MRASGVGGVGKGSGDKSEHHIHFPKRRKLGLEFHAFPGINE